MNRGVAGRISRGVANVLSPRKLIRLPSPMSKPGKSGLTIAIEGCCHGELDKIYDTLQHLERVEGRKVDLLISCGDFQAVRNMDDLETMACPPKYRDMQTFYKYFSGEKRAPVPTLFIGGNHEAANHLWELYYGGWAAPNIFFLGFTGVVRFGGVRIAGLSGIYAKGDYMKGHHERLPYDSSTMRSMYHVRDFEAYRLMQIQQPLDIFLSHDWPRNIVHHGDKEALLRRKTFLRSEIESSELGSPASEQLLKALQPSYWFSAHMHTKFPAVVEHAGGKATRFLALDKCLPGRDFLQVLELEAEGPKVFEYDPEWLAILRSTHSQMNLSRQHRPLPYMGTRRMGPSHADMEFVEQALAARGNANVPLNFQPTAPAFNPQLGTRQQGRMPARHVRNPQTEALLQLLQLPYSLDHANPPKPTASSQGPIPAQNPSQAAQDGRGGNLATPPPPPIMLANPEEIELGDFDDADSGLTTQPTEGGGAASSAGRGVEKMMAANPEEIDLEDDAEGSQGGDEPAALVKGQGVPVGQGARDHTDVAMHAEDPMFQPMRFK
ncbi:lariat debranching enzyme, C-terminal domain-containing protein [Haematococcus lacustris]